MPNDRDALIGPVQIVSVMLHEPTWDGRIADQLVKLEEAGIITIIDAALVVRESEDEFTTLDVDTEIIPGRPLLGAVVGALLGLGAAGEEGAVEGALLGAEEGFDPVDSDDLMLFAEELPIGGAAAVVVFEQTWARPLMGAIRDSGGEILSDDVFHAEDVIDAGIDIGAMLFEED
jgi:uncharacterized membrane protein